MKLDYLSADDIAEYRVKFHLLLRCLVDLRFWKELFLSQGLRTIALSFIRRHFKILTRSVS